jgi:hypothetical protein
MTWISNKYTNVTVSSTIYSNNFSSKMQYLLYINIEIDLIDNVFNMNDR